MSTLNGWEERRPYHGERIAEGDETDAALGIRHGPLGKRELCRILAQDGDVAPSFASEPFASDVEERFTEVDEVDGVELSDRKVFVHELDVVTCL